MGRFRCANCGDTFPNSSGLGSHRWYAVRHGCGAKERGYNVFRNSSGTSFRCLYCGFTSNNARKMGVHTMRHRKAGDFIPAKESKKFDCPFCDKKEMNKNAYGAHIKWVHKDKYKMAKATVAKQLPLFEEEEVEKKLDNTISALKVVGEVNRILEKDEPLTEKEAKILKDYAGRLMAANGLRSGNTKFLRGIMCPKCRSNGRFSILGAIDVMVSDDGIDKGELDRVFWDEKDRIQCLTCQHKGTVGSFSIGTDVSMSAAFIR